jgi:glycosyltransferase involved in cell wall biosynthesis
MRILVVCQHYWPEAFQVTEICEALAARGHEVTAVVGLPNYPSGVVPAEYRRFRRRREERNGVHVRRCFEIGRKNTKVGLAVNYVSYMLSACHRVLWMRRDYDVIYAYSTSPVLMSLPAAFLRAISGKKLLIYVLDIWPACLAAMNVREGSALYAFMRRVSRRIYARADVLAYSSRRFEAYLQKVHGITVSKDDYLPQFADARFERLPEKPPAQGGTSCSRATSARCRGGNAASGGRSAAKRTHPLAHRRRRVELRRVRGAFPGAEAGGRRDPLRPPPAEEMPGFYTLADAMLVSMRNDPSVIDTLPAKVQGYMAAGKPILGSIAGETPDIVAEANCGLCAPPDDPEAFAVVVRAFIARGDQAQMGENARNYYLSHFTREGHMEHLERMLKRLAGEKA